jgi:glycosyltransferase involved in cell wall biosynthesis
MRIDLTIGMATYDDPQGVWWTLSSLRMHHQLDGVELLVVDDHPEPNRGDIHHVCANSRARYVHAPKAMGPAHAKNSVWEHAQGSHVLVIDCHVLLVPGAVEALVAAARADAVGRDMWVGP